MACPKEQAEEVKAWLVKAMVDGMETVVNGPEILNPGLDADHCDRVHVEVEAEILESWGD